MLSKSGGVIQFTETNNVLSFEKTNGVLKDKRSIDNKKQTSLSSHQNMEMNKEEILEEKKRKKNELKKNLDDIKIIEIKYSGEKKIYPPLNLSEKNERDLVEEKLKKLDLEEKIKSKKNSPQEDIIKVHDFVQQKMYWEMEEGDFFYDKNVIYREEQSFEDFEKRNRPLTHLSRDFYHNIREKTSGEFISRSCETIAPRKFFNLKKCSCFRDKKGNVIEEKDFVKDFSSFLYSFNLKDYGNYTPDRIKILEDFYKRDKCEFPVSYEYMAKSKIEFEKMKLLLDKQFPQKTMEGDVVEDKKEDKKIASKKSAESVISVCCDKGNIPLEVIVQRDKEKLTATIMLCARRNLKTTKYLPILLSTAQNGCKRIYRNLINSRFRYVFDNQDAMHKDLVFELKKEGVFEYYYKENLLFYRVILPLVKCAEEIKPKMEKSGVEHIYLDNERLERDFIEEMNILTSKIKEIYFMGHAICDKEEQLKLYNYQSRFIE